MSLLDTIAPLIYGLVALPAALLFTSVMFLVTKSIAHSRSYALNIGYTLVLVAGFVILLLQTEIPSNSEVLTLVGMAAAALLLVSAASVYKTRNRDRL